MDEPEWNYIESTRFTMALGPQNSERSTRLGVSPGSVITQEWDPVFQTEHKCSVPGASFLGSNPSSTIRQATSPMYKTGRELDYMCFPNWHNENLCSAKIYLHV